MADDTERLLGGILEAVKTLKDQQQQLLAAQQKAELEVASLKVKLAILVSILSGAISIAVSFALKLV